MPAKKAPALKTAGGAVLKPVSRRKKPDTKRFDRHLSSIAKGKDYGTNLSADMVHVWGEMTKIVLNDLTDTAAQVRDFSGAKTLSARHFVAALTTLFPPELAKDANEAGTKAVAQWGAK